MSDLYGQVDCHRLANGLRVLLHRDDRLPLVRTSTNIMHRLTTVSFVLFVVLSMSLAIISGKRYGSVMEAVEAAPPPASSEQAPAGEELTAPPAGEVVPAPEQGPVEGAEQPASE